ncbi:MAG: DUF3488 and transglutaminase-like domain-containing protein [Pseudomonadota bacterium]|nr:DUF3488 and transglutaminase-like domain-containing protein [Pseudomonadota bacterium]
MLELRTRQILLLTLALALAPLLPQLPLALAIGTPAIALLMAWAGQRGALPAWLKLPLTLLAILMVFALFGFRLGRDTGCGLLAMMLALKPLETHSLRDARSLVGFALFAPFSTFLLDQGPATLLLGLAASLAALTCLQRLADVEAGIPPLPISTGIRGIGKLVLLGLPLALAVFWLFPRISTPLWGIPDRASAKVGLSNSMSPGDWLELLVDDSPAMRVRFAGEAPPSSQMYWRGPVLWDFDGRTWKNARPPLPTTQLHTSTQGSGWTYQLEIEPSEQHYIAALDLPLAAPSGSLMSPDGNLLSPHKLQSLTRWQLQSAPPLMFQPQLSDAERQRALAFPRQFNPRAQHLALQWQLQSGGNPEAIIAQAMTLVNRELAYSLDAPMLARDSVDEFLFQTKLGYCEHFSSSFVFLMRAAGVPARVVTGYAGGYHNPVGGYWVVRNSDAHAWAEVWLQGQGWVRIDPTAAVAPERIYDTVADRMPGNFAGGLINFNQAWNLADLLRSNWNDFVLSFNAERQSRMLSQLGIDRISPEQLILLLAIAIALSLAAMLWWLSRGEREPDPLLRAWHQLSARYSRLGLARERHESAQDWSERIATARPQDAVAIRSLAHDFSQDRYAKKRLSRAALRNLVRRLKQHRPG